jgi:hypothetical protein
MVMIVQLLCPARHCVFGAAYVEGTETFEQVQTGIKEAMKKLGAKDYCGICGSADLTFEERRTAFKTIEEITPALMQSMADQAASRAYLDAQGLTFDVQRRN